MTLLSNSDVSVGIGAVHCVLPDKLVTVAELPEFSLLGKEEADFAAGICSQVVGEENVNRNPNLIVASEDFSFMLEKVPGCYFNIGNGAGEGTCEVHNSGYDFNDDALVLGASVFARIVETRLAKGS